MREILFRGKLANEDDRRWVGGTWACGNLVHQTEYYGDSVDRYHILYTGEFDCDFYDSVLVNPETVGQYIGIKDKNDNRIFEGDIVKFHAYRYEPDWIGTVTYDDRNALYLFVGVLPYRYDSSHESNFEVQISAKDKDTFEIIGNKWDNPELLGEDAYVRLLNLD